VTTPVQRPSADGGMLSLAACGWPATTSYRRLGSLLLGTKMARQVGDVCDDRSAPAKAMLAYSVARRRRHPLGAAPLHGGVGLLYPPPSTHSSALLVRPFHRGSCWWKSGSKGGRRHNSPLRFFPPFTYYHKATSTTLDEERK
jgi:hypothetical protein